MIIRTKRKRSHIRTVENAIYHLKYDLLNDALNAHQIEFLDKNPEKMTAKEIAKLVEYGKKMSDKAQKVVKYNKYLSILKF